MTVVARDRPADTTSAVAAALWFPYRVLPYDRVLAWSATGYTAFARLAADRPESASGCAGAPSCCCREPGDEWWAPAVPALAVTPRPAGLHGGMAVPRPGRRHGPVPAVAGRRGRGRGCHAGAEAVGCATWAGLGALVVDCAGLGARDLVPDPTVTPVRGQVVVTDPVGVGSGWG